MEDKISKPRVADKKWEMVHSNGRSDVMQVHLDMLR